MSRIVTRFCGVFAQWIFYLFLILCTQPKSFPGVKVLTQPSRKNHENPAAEYKQLRKIVKKGQDFNYLIKLVKTPQNLVKIPQKFQIGDSTNWKEYFPKLPENWFWGQIFVYWARYFKFWLLAYFFILLNCAKFEEDWTTFILHILQGSPLWILGKLQKQKTLSLALFVSFILSFGNLSSSVVIRFWRLSKLLFVQLNVGSRLNFS